MLIDKALAGKKKEKTLEERQAEAVKGTPDGTSEAEWKEYIRKKTIGNLRKAGADLAKKSSQQCH